MTDNEIIKALECCNSDNDCKNCPLMRRTDVNCDDTLKKEALDIIKRQQAEIEKAKSEAITEFAERLKTKIVGLEVKSPNAVYKGGMEDVLYYHMPKIIDQLVKEMTEGDNGTK